MKSLWISCVVVLSVMATLVQAQKAGRREVDPEPDEFVMMDKGAELDQKSLMKNFVYPDSARRNGIMGTVTVTVLIGKQGKAERYIILEPVHPLLDSAAAFAVMHANYKSAIYDKNPIKTWMEIPIIFKIGNKRASPVTIIGAEEGDGYLRARFDAAAFYASLDRDVMETAPKADVKIEIAIDSTGVVTDVVNSSQCPEPLFNDIRDHLKKIRFQPSIQDGKAAAERQTLVIDPHYK